MKKTLLIISITIFTLSMIKAQEKIKFGVKGGINFSNMTSDYYAENNSKTGLHVGLFAEIPLGNKFSIQPEILYSTHGADVRIMMDGGGPTLTKYSLDYIQFPVLGKIYVFKNLSIEIGPSFNLLVNDKGYRPDLLDIVDENGVFIRNQTDIDPNGSTFEFSGVLGISYKFKGDFFGSVRYLQGLTGAIDDRETKNNGFQLGLGYKF